MHLAPPRAGRVNLSSTDLLNGLLPRNWPPLTLCKQELNMLGTKEAYSKFYRITTFETVRGAVKVWWQELYPWHLAWVPQPSLPRDCGLHTCVWKGQMPFQMPAGLPEDAGHTDLKCPVDQAELPVPILDWFLITVTMYYTFKRLNRWARVVLTWWDILQIITSSSKSQGALYCHSLINRLGRRQ